MKNLIFSSVGDNTNFDNTWLGKDREYDVFVIYYGSEEKNFLKYSKKVDYIEKRKGDKWQNFHYLYTTQHDKIQEYDRIFFLDDDIIITTEDINKMFKLSLECNLKICQPSFALGSEIGWDINTSNPNYFLRYTNFVENNSCLMTKDSINKFMEIYDPKLVSFGVDYIYMVANGVEDIKNLKKFAIIDNIQCINPPGKLKTKEKIKNTTVESFQLQYKDISEKYWPNNDITNSKTNSREFSKLKNSSKRKELFLEYCKKNNFNIHKPRILGIVKNKIQQIEHSKSNFSPFIDVKFDKTITFEKNNEDKIAFLFLTRNNLKQPQLWYDFLSDGNGKCNVYAHTKERDKLNQQFLIDHQIPEHIHTEWGDSNLLTATNALIKNALKDLTNKRFVLVSESCIPLHFYKVIYDILFNQQETAGKSFLYTKLTPTSKDPKHIKIKDAAYTQICRNGDPSKELGITWENMMRNSQWMILNREHAEIANKYNHENLWKNFNVADEWYYYNVIRHYDPKIEENIIDYLKPTWFGVDISKFKTKEDVEKFRENPNAHPNEFTEVEIILKQKDTYPSLFLRKVSQDVKLEYKHFHPNFRKEF
mgnify:CR=1 FL=1